jgi:hypothetical protein
MGTTQVARHEARQLEKALPMKIVPGKDLSHPESGELREDEERS